MRVLIALSGGVDSSVAAALLREQGHDLVGVTFHLWDAAGDNKVGRCCAPEDRDDARRTAEELGFPHYVIDERAAFRQRVVEPFLDSYLGGTTPAPCVACNQHVKVHRLVELADRFGCERIATGHYARIVRTQVGARSEARLLRGRDRNKDQSYFLYGVPPAALERLLFPLGELTKDQTRAEGVRLGVPNAGKPDSQELCFVPDGDIGGFVERERALSQEGEIRDQGGSVVGAHQGIYRYTVGQRRGLNLGGGPARYVLRVVPEDKSVVVGDDAALLSASCRAEAAAWCNGAPAEPFEADVRVRYRHAPARARVYPEAHGFRVEFVEPQRAITPGQAAVVYRGEEVVGGGIIA
ncbi:MAG: tRNA-specific 2-thiouridylase MnmA [Myxococcaceae bacterium]|nr:tRNA-specific 2-thiouridylase MnmA [Myxococcaceae bacterium]